jgi:hypothetical protein
MAPAFLKSIPYVHRERLTQLPRERGRFIMHFMWRYRLLFTPLANRLQLQSRLPPQTLACREWRAIFEINHMILMCFDGSPLPA